MGGRPGPGAGWRCTGFPTSGGSSTSPSGGTGMPTGASTAASPSASSTAPSTTASPPGTPAAAPRGPSPVPPSVLADRGGGVNPPASSKEPYRTTWAPPRPPSSLIVVFEWVWVTLVRQSGCAGSSFGVCLFCPSSPRIASLKKSHRPAALGFSPHPSRRGAPVPGATDGDGDGDGDGAAALLHLRMFTLLTRYEALEDHAPGSAGRCGRGWHGGWVNASTPRGRWAETGC